MSRELDALVLARNALKAALGSVPVLIRGDPDPPSAPEVVILDLIADTARGTYGLDVSDRLVQVSVYTTSNTTYTATMAKALNLLEHSRTALRGAGFRYRQARPAITTPGEYGFTADFDI
ncbi:hypothetical protein ACFP81_06395 [Deinococcus lacus]|uniref:DUF3168 domain-containing protein n=1 Tax=Deinococcus lacus TaxID=392561 RepID=A0ABW1YBI8_9DEIO